MGFWSFMRDMMLFDWLFGKRHKGNSSSCDNTGNATGNTGGNKSNNEPDNGIGTVFIPPVGRSCRSWDDGHYASDDYYHDSHDDYAHDFDDFDDDF